MSRSGAGTVVEVVDVGGDVEGGDVAGGVVVGAVVTVVSGAAVVEEGAPVSEPEHAARQTAATASSDFARFIVPTVARRHRCPVPTDG